jgi:Spy/CpxP family protein refolding chaperone
MTKPSFFRESFKARSFWPFHSKHAAILNPDVGIVCSHVRVDALESCWIARRRKMRTTRKIMAALAGALLAGTVQAQATKPTTPQAPPPGAGYGAGMAGCPGMMGGGMGPGMMGGGMGPGMMGGGMGPGMMGGGMGPGMMGGGMGPGMMGGGMGPGMGGGYGMLSALNLNDQQRKEVGKILDDHQKRRYELMGKNIDLQSRLRDLYGQEKWDANAIAGVYDQMAKVHTDLIRSRVEARNRIYNVLTPDQRRQYRQWGDPVTE